MLPSGIITICAIVMYGSKKLIKYDIEDFGDYDSMLPNDLAGMPYMLDQRGAGFALAPRNDNPVIYLEVASSGGRRIQDGKLTQPKNLGRLYFELRKVL